METLFILTAVLACSAYLVRQQWRRWRYLRAVRRRIKALRQYNPVPDMTVEDWQEALDL